MSDNLRDRIAAAIAKAQFAFDQGEPYNGPEDEYVLADAVIANLGLRRENVELLHRWVTEWERPEYCNRCGIPHLPGQCRREENR